MSQVFCVTMDRHRALAMHAFIDMFRKRLNVDNAMAAAIVATFAMIAASAYWRPASLHDGSPCCDPGRIEDYRGPRA